MKQRNYELAHEFLAAVSSGELPDSLLTSDMTGWITTGGTMNKASYQHLIRLLAAMCARPLAFSISSLTADEDRVVAEATSEGVLVNGEVYRNTYVFVLRVRDGRICSVAEHYNALIVQQKLLPLMKEATAKVLGKSP